MKPWQIIRFMALAQLGAAVSFAQAPAAKPADPKAAVSPALPPIEQPDWLFPHPPKPLPTPAVKPEASIVLSPAPPVMTAR